MLAELAAGIPRAGRSTRLVAALLALMTLGVPAARGTDPLAFANFAAPGSIRNSHGAGETSIGVNPATNATMFLMTTTTAHVTWDDTQSPPVATWRDRSFVLTGTTTLDPILWTDRTTGRTFVAQLAGEASLVAFTDDDGETWTPTQPPTAAPHFDHETIGGGPYNAALPPFGGIGYPNAIYYCAQLDGASCARSDDGGLTWGPPIPISVPPVYTNCSGPHGHVVVAPDGRVYVPHRLCNPNGNVTQGVITSFDNGMSWSRRLVPGTTFGNSDPAVAVDAAGRAYFVAESGGAPVVSTSTDGTTWSPLVDLGAPFGIRNVKFPMAVAGSSGRAAVAFYGTATPGNDQAASFQGAWYLYVSVTTDGGATWTTVNATPGDPVQRGCIWMGGGTNACRNLYDFQGMTMDAQGRVLVGYADGCTSTTCRGPNGTPQNSRDSLGTIARQTGGPPLTG